MTKNLFSVPTAQTFWGKHGARRGHITGNATDQDTLYAPTVGRLAVFVNYGEMNITLVREFLSGFNTVNRT